ncbi:MAG: TadE/TadG family type IV pilus assembly protein [Kordiimonas sp.]
MKLLPSIWKRKPRKPSNALASDETGSVLVETAVGLPVLLSTIFGILEIGNFVFVTAAVENAVLHASRFGVTGLTEDGSSRIEQVKEIIKEHTFGQVDMDTVEIETLVYEQFANIGEPEPFTDQNGSGDWDTGEPFVDVNGNGNWDDDMGSEGLGGGGDIVVYRIKYTASSLTGVADWATKQINISSTVAVRNEPY